MEDRERKAPVGKVMTIGDDQFVMFPPGFDLGSGEVEASSIEDGLLIRPVLANPPIPIEPLPGDPA